MPSLSTPIGDLQSEYGVVVVGSGYGGAIAGYRMAAYAKPPGDDLPEYSVCVLERGSERQAGDFPTTASGALLDTQADTKVGRVGSRTALFDFRMNHDVSVVVGCGLGGTSLINAAVMLEPTPKVLDDPGLFELDGERPPLRQNRLHRRGDVGLGRSGSLGGRMRRRRAIPTTGDHTGRQQRPDDEPESVELSHAFDLQRKHRVR